MYQKILVPLDGSDVAECVLPHVKAIARGCGGRQLILIRVVEPLPAGMYVDLDPGTLQKAGLEEAKQYLAKVQAELKKAGVDSEVKVVTGRAAEAIADFAQREKVDLIILATHGRTGISRWIFGSVADRLLRSSPAPVLVIRPQGFGAGR
jgi:nucleotide-binding universal stress UspA family protein